MLLKQPGKILTLLLQTSKRIQNFKLPAPMKQRLMLMRPVNIHQPLAELRKNSDRRG